MKVTNRITRLVAAGLVAGALAAPAASARPAPLDTPVPPSTGETLVVEPAPPVVPSVEDGFDWASAAIGAGGAGAVALLIGAGGITYRHRHEQIGIAP